VRRPAARRWARVRGFAVPPASHRGEADARLAANWSVPGSHFSTGTNSRQPVAFPRVVLSPSERGRSARRTVVHHRRAGTTRYPTAARSPVRSADHQARLVSTSATRRSGGYPPPCPDTLCGYLFTKGYCIEIVVRNLVTSARRSRHAQTQGLFVHKRQFGACFLGSRPHGRDTRSGESGLTSPDTCGGMGRNAQKSALNAFKRRASCNSRAIRPSQSGFGFTHNPGVVGSSPTRPTSTLVLVHYTWPYLAGSRRRQTRSDRAYSARQVVKEWAQFLGRGGSLNPQTSPAQPSGRQEVALQ
jgi:hypothetical protein